MLEVLLHRLHLLISHDCPLAIRHKKGEIVDCILEFLICILFILALMHFFLYGLYMLGGDIMFMLGGDIMFMCFYVFYVSCFTYGT